MSKQKTIVFIEDEPHLQEELTAALVEEGYTVKNAYDGEAGLALIMKENPDLVLLDLILPKKDGFEILEAIKANPATKHISVIVLSNLETVENVDRAVSLGATAYLVKPNYEIAHITEKIKNVLGNS
ncbi:MAG: response regulator [bacterium]|nr:response regulator [bacterium]